MMTSQVDIRATASQYFATINPIAVKIRADIDAVADCYEHLWTTFSAAEQGDVINETIIKPTAVLQYSTAINVPSRSGPAKRGCGGGAGNDDTDDDVPATSNDECGYDGRRLATFAKQRTGLKRIQDDVCGVYRDEHSRPFAVKTKSQIALHLFAADGDLDEVDFRQVNPSGSSSYGSQGVIDTKIAVPNHRSTAVAPKETNIKSTATAASHASPSNSIVLPPAVSSAQLSPIHGSSAGSSKPTTFLAKLMNRSVTSAGGGAGSSSHDDQQRLVGDDDQLSSSIIIAPTMGIGSSSAAHSSQHQCILSFSSTEDDDDDKHNFDELNALLDTAATSTASSGRRRSGGHHTTSDAQTTSLDTNVTAATYDFLNNW